MSEAGFWADQVRPKLQPFGVLHRVENSAALGTPDVAYCLRFSPTEAPASGWLELKYAATAPLRPATPLRFEHLTLEQVRFLEAWAGAGGRAWLLLRLGRAVALLGPQAVRRLYAGDLRTRDLPDAAAVYAATAFPTGRILRCLTR